MTPWKAFACTVVKPDSDIAFLAFGTACYKMGTRGIGSAFQKAKEFSQIRSK